MREAVHISSVDMGVSPNGVPPNGWFEGEHPIKVDDLGGPPFMDPRYDSCTVNPIINHS